MHQDLLGLRFLEKNRTPLQLVLFLARVFHAFIWSRSAPPNAPEAPATGRDHGRVGRTRCFTGPVDLEAHLMTGA